MSHELPDWKRLANGRTPELQLALQAARLGGDILLEYWSKLNSSQIQEKAHGDLVTSADLKSEEVISEFLSREMPTASILAEEGSARDVGNLIWYLDPLDGTTNFVQRFPIFAVSLGLVDISDSTNPRVICGVVFNPVSNELYFASRGHGSFKSDKKLSVSNKEKFSDSLIGTGFPRRHSSELSKYLREFAEIYPRCRGVRRAGSAALDLCWTAEGIYDGFWEHKLCPWDIAAGVLIVEEAGGICTDFSGERNFLESGNIVGAPKLIHSELLKLIQSV